MAQQSHSHETGASPVFSFEAAKLIQQLNAQFAIDGKLRFVEGSEACVMIEATTRHAKATISTYGAQILGYQPHDAEQDMLFLSPQSQYGNGKAIRGGVPLCWPWFGDDPTGRGRPAHGFARNRVWQVNAVKLDDEDQITISMSLPNSEDFQQYWHSAFKLSIEIQIGKTLKISLTTENCDQETFVISQALHTYFQVGDIEQVWLRGLDNYHYLDKTDSFHEKLQHDHVWFKNETDRVYLHSPEQLFIEDAALNRRIVVESHGSETTVVWNPWHKASQLADMADDAYKTFVCVETANAAADSIRLAPGQSHTLMAEYWLMSRD